MGCGGGSSGPATHGTASASASTRTEADRLLAEAAAALATARSFHVQGMIDPDLTLDLRVGPQGATGRVTSHGVTWDLLVIGQATWMRGAGLWAASLPAARAAALGDGWVRVTDPAAAFGHARALGRLDYSIPAIVFGPHADLAVTGHPTIAGRPAVELRSRTDTYDVAATGTPYPLRWLDSDIPGPDGRPCGITLDGFDAPLTLTPPAAVVGTVGPTPSPSP